MNQDWLELDGSAGGGQILRSALSLSMHSGRPFRIGNIRAQRSRPGLLRQHLTAVQAAAQVCAAHTEGAQLGSQRLSFRPGPIQAGDYRFAIGSAGSCTLVLQTLLPALLRAPGPSRVRISGGTHNPLAPPAEFLELAWLPLLRRMGARVELQLLRHGFVPAGGGELELRVQPSELRPLHLERRGKVLRQQARALLAGLPGHVGERELARVAQRLHWPRACLRLVRLDETCGPGNALLLEIVCAQVSELFCAFGQRGLPAEKVADQAIDQAQDWLASEAAVAEQLADQLLLPLALAGGGSFTCNRVTVHLRSNLAVIQRFLPLEIRLEELAPNLTRVVVGEPGPPP